jgi:hypothetical protein
VVYESSSLWCFVIVAQVEQRHSKIQDKYLDPKCLGSETYWVLDSGILTLMSYLGDGIQVHP